MGSLTDILNIARSALAANQQAMQVLGHNIANAGTKGYSAQKVDFTSNSPLRTTQGIFGRGVNSQSITRAEEKFLTQRILFESQTLGKWTAIKRAVSEIELSFSNPGENDLSAAITNFFNAVEELSINPENIASRTNLVQRAEFMVSKFNSTAELLVTSQNNIDREIRSVARQVNELSASIANINELITISEASGDMSNDLRDKRDLMLADLADLVNIQVTEKESGGVIVSLDGNLIVDGNIKRELVLTQKASGDRSITNITIKGSSNTIKFEGGRLGGLLEARDDYIGSYRSKLDLMAKDLSNKINGIHSKGFDLDGNTGINFFKSNIESARDMALSSDVKSDVRKIAAAGGYDSTGDLNIDMSNGPGDNSVIRSIAGLRNSVIDSSGKSTIYDYYSDLLGTLAFDSKRAEDMKDTQNALLNQLINMKESKVGVSLDEELAKMIIYQNNYIAATRIISTIEKMLKSVLEMVG